MTRQKITAYLFSIILIFLLVLGYYAASFFNSGSAAEPFNGSRAYADVQTQVAFGPRSPGSEGHAIAREWISSELKSSGWEVVIHNSSRMGHPIHNILAKRSKDAPEIILGAHYDTRFFADQDPDPGKHSEPVPGANDGASGVAVLLELARSLPKDTVPVWLVFFDTEDNGRIEGWDWILGSRAFVEEVEMNPHAVVIADMIGDADLNIYLERNSDTAIREEIWDIAASLGHDDVFIAGERHSMLDDHTPFLEAGIPAVDIIDFDYKYWHTTEDTPDKVSAESLQAVGETLWHWVTAQSQ